MRAKIKNIIYLFLAAAVVCLASIITEAHAASAEITSEISSCRFADQPIRCALDESKLEVEPLNFTTVGQTFDATIKFTNNTDKEMSVVDESDTFTHANLKREIFTEEDFNGKLEPGASTNITIRLSYIAATAETLQLDNLGFNITFTPAEESFTLTEATTDAQPEDLPQNSTNPNTADTVIPFAIFSGSSLILAFILHKKAIGKVFAVAFIASATAIPQTTATALDKIAFNITFAGIDNQPLAIYINQPEEKTEEPEPEVDAEAPTSDDEAENPEESTRKAPEAQEETVTEEQEAEAESAEEQPVESAQPEEKSAEPTRDEEQPTTEPEKLPIYIEPTKETEEQSAEAEQAKNEPAKTIEPEEPTITEPEKLPIYIEAEKETQPTEDQKSTAEEPSQPKTEELPINIETEKEQQVEEEKPSEDQPTEETAEQSKEEQQAPIENSITETEPAKTEIKTEEPTQEQMLVKGGYKYANACPGATGYDDWGLVKCQCVSYGANRVYNQFGKFPNWRGHANAYEWIGNAQNEGFVVTNTPKPGAIGVLPRGQYSSYGHIVYVEKVEGDRVYISQYNEWPAKGDYSEKWADASTYQYIYFYEYAK